MVDLEKEKIERYLQQCANGNRKDIIYIIGRDLFLSKDPIARAEAWRQINKIIEYYNTHPYRDERILLAYFYEDIQHAHLRIMLEPYKILRCRRSISPLRGADYEYRSEIL
jgi:hypothetical protein